MLEDASLRAAALRVLARILRWLVSGRGAGPVGAALGAAGTALLLEGPAGAGATGDNATAGAVGLWWPRRLPWGPWRARQRLDAWAWPGSWRVQL